MGKWVAEIVAAVIGGVLVWLLTDGLVHYLKGPQNFNPPPYMEKHTEESPPVQRRDDPPPSSRYSGRSRGSVEDDPPPLQ